MTARTLALFAALGVIWGVPYLLIKEAMLSFTPVTLVLLRCVIGSLVLVPLALRQGAFPLVRRHWRAVLAYTGAEILVPWPLLGHAESVVSSGLAALVIAGVPLVGVVLSALFGRPEPLTVRSVLGFVLGTAGVALLVAGQLSAPGEGAALAVVELGIVTVGYALGPQIIRHSLQEVPSYGVIAASLIVPAVVYAPLGVAQWPAHVEPAAAWAVLALGLICTATAFVVFFALISAVGPVQAGVVTYLNPAVAVLVGALFLAEPLTPVTFVAFAAIVGGSYLVQRRPRPVA